jgi:hypothetical protein
MLNAVTRQAHAVDKKAQEYNAAHASTITVAYFFDMTNGNGPVQFKGKGKARASDEDLAIRAEH